jgi:hypothetical protein
MTARRTGVSTLGLVLGLSGCLASSKSGELLDGYRAATCVTPLAEPKRIQPPTREWDAVLSLRDGSKVAVFGYQAVGGHISVKYGRPEVEAVVANSGDYVYPSDVRVDNSRDIMYVKTSGLGGGLRQETWLFEYDLAKHSRLRVARVDPTVLPPECGLPGHASH